MLVWLRATLYFVPPHVLLLAVVTIVKYSDESAVRAKYTVESGTGASRHYDSVFGHPNNKTWYSDP